MNQVDKVAICSRSFSKNPFLRERLTKQYKNTKFNDEGLSLEGDALVGFLENQDKVICGLEVFNGKILSKLPKLKVISKYGVGTDNLDLDTMANREIRLGWKGGVNKRSVSELVLSLTLSLLRLVPQANEDLRKGNWNQFKGNLLTGKTFGIVGYGNTGKDLAELLEPFNCKILIYDVYKINNNESNRSSQVSFDSLFKSSDIISLHLPYNGSTSNLINSKVFSIMKSSSILINLSRGGIVNEPDLKEALKNRVISASAMDVFLQEPPNDMELLNLPNFFGTPHIGGIAIEAIEAMGLAAIEGLDTNQIPVLR